MPDDRIDVFAQPPGWPIALGLWELYRLRRDPDYIPPASVEERARRRAEADARSAFLREQNRGFNAEKSERARRGAETRRRRAREEADSRAGLARVEGSGERSLRDIQEQLAELTASDDDEDLQPRAPERRGPAARRDQGERGSSGRTKRRTRAVSGPRGRRAGPTERTPAGARRRG